MIEGLAGLTVMMLLCCLRIPISFSMAIVGIAGYAYMRDWNWTVAFAMTQTKLYETGRNYTLSVVPLFILMGNFVTRAGMSQELFRAAYAFIGHLRGGLAMKTLLELKRQGRREYGVLAARYTSEFHEKWIEGGAPPDEPLLGSSDIQSLADLANSYTVIGEMKPVPFGKETIVQVVGAAAIPLLPLALSIIPADQILQRLLGLLL